VRGLARRLETNDTRPTFQEADRSRRYASFQPFSHLGLDERQMAEDDRALRQEVQLHRCTLCGQTHLHTQACMTERGCRFRFRRVLQRALARPWDHILDQPTF
jgi:hypothetical protein